MTSPSFSAPLPTSHIAAVGTPGTPPAAGAQDLVVGVLAVQGDVREHIATITALGGRAVPIRRASELAAIDGLIIPGGESTTMDKLTRTFGLAEPLRELIAGGLPVYGSCAGMILLADTITDPAKDREGTAQRTLGGLDITVRRNAFGRQRESFETDVTFAGLAGTGEPVRAVFIRAPWVERVGDGVEVLARVPAGESPGPGPSGDTGGSPGGSPARAGEPDLAAVARIVAVRSGNLLATSFHPEVTGERRVHELFIRMIRGEA